MGSRGNIAVKSDECLVKRTIAGDHQAFAELRQRYYRFVIDFARSIMKRNDVDDLVQEIWLRVFQKAHQWERRSSFRTWLGSIVLNTCRTEFVQQNYVKHDRRITISLDGGNYDTGHSVLDDVGFSHDSGTETTIVRITLEKIQEQLKRFRPVSEQSFRLMMEGYSMKDIAKKLGKSVDSVKADIHRARKFMKKLYYEGKYNGNNAETIREKEK